MCYVAIHYVTRRYNVLRSVALPTYMTRAQATTPVYMPGCSTYIHPYMQTHIHTCVRNYTPAYVIYTCCCLLCRATSAGAVPMSLQAKHTPAKARQNPQHAYILCFLPSDFRRRCEEVYRGQERDTGGGPMHSEQRRPLLQLTSIRACIHTCMRACNRCRGPVSPRAASPRRARRAPRAAPRPGGR